ncbi:MAG: flagellar hook-length control protein FliK [Planctomycetaceae bacterium]
MTVPAEHHAGGSLRISSAQHPFDNSPRLDRPETKDEFGAVFNTLLLPNLLNQPLPELSGPESTVSPPCECSADAPVGQTDAPNPQIETTGLGNWMLASGLPSPSGPVGAPGLCEPGTFEPSTNAVSGANADELPSDAEPETGIDQTVRVHGGRSKSDANNVPTAPLSAAGSELDAASQRLTDEEPQFTSGSTEPNAKRSGDVDRPIEQIELDHGAKGRKSTAGFEANDRLNAPGDVGGAHSHDSGPLVGIADLSAARVAELAKSSAGFRADSPHARDISGQLADAIVTRTHFFSHAGGTSFELKLDPPELGSVWVRLTSSQHGVDAHFVVADEASRRLIESQLPSLRESLQDAGISLHQFDVSQHGSGPQQWSDQQDRAPLGISPTRAELSEQTVSGSRDETIRSSSHVDLIA